MDSILDFALAPLGLLLYSLGLNSFLITLLALVVTFVTVVVTKMPEGRVARGAMKIGIYIMYSTIFQLVWLIFRFVSRDGDFGDIYRMSLQTVAFVKQFGDRVYDTMQLTALLVICILVLLLPTFRKHNKVYVPGRVFAIVMTSAISVALLLSWPAIASQIFWGVQDVKTNTGVVLDNPSLCRDFDTECIGKIAIERSDPTVCAPLIVNEAAYIGCVYGAGGNWESVRNYCSDDGLYNTRCLQSASRSSYSDPIADRASLAHKDEVFCPVLYDRKDRSSKVSECYFSAGGMAKSESGVYQASTEGDWQKNLQVIVRTQKTNTESARIVASSTISLNYKVVSSPQILGWDGDERVFILINQGVVDTHLYMFDIKSGIKEISRPNKDLNQEIRAVPADGYIEFIGYENGKEVRDKITFAQL